MPNTPPPADPVPSPDQPQGALHLAAWLLSAALIIMALHYGQEVLIPLCVAFLISFVLGPAVTWIERRGCNRGIAVMLVMLVVFSAFGALGALVASELADLARDLPSYQTTIREKLTALREGFSGPGLFDGAIETVGSLQAEVDKVAATPPPDVQQVEIVGERTSPLTTAMMVLAPTLAPIATTGIVLVFVFLMLLDQGDLRDRLLRLMGGNLNRSTDALAEAGARISKYLLMQVAVNVSYAVPMGLGLWLIGVPGWILWGTLAALMRFIPYVGPLISAVFPLSLAFAVDPGWEMLLWALALILVLELVSNNVIEPLLYGSSTGLSAISLIAAATFWTALWGPVGLVLSTPLTVCLLVIGRYLPQLRFFEVLLGSAPVLDVPSRLYQRLIADDPEDAMQIVEDIVARKGVGGFVDDEGLGLLRRVSDDYLGQARPEHRLRLVRGLDLLIEDLREDHPADPPGPARVALLAGKWEIDHLANDMIAHALAIEGIATVTRREGLMSRAHLDALALDDAEVIVLTYMATSPEVPARTFLRRLRQRWPDRQVILALLNMPPDQAGSDEMRALGADQVAASPAETVLRVIQALDPAAIAARQQAARPEDDGARIAVLEASDVLDGRAREQLDDIARRVADVFDVRFAVISAIDAEQEFIIGQSTPLPGQRTDDGSDMIIMPRAEAICDHVVSSGHRLVVSDTRRDPRFTDHPAIALWNTRFYAGAPLRTREGHVLGALCLLDTEPRSLEAEEMVLLDSLAAEVVTLITGEVTKPVADDDPRTASTQTGQPVPD